MKTYIVKPNGATHPSQLFLAEVVGDGYAATVKLYERGSYPAGKEYTIESPVLREDFSEEETLTIFKKWDGCIEISMDEHFCGSGGGAQFDELAFMMKTGSFFCNDFTEYDHEENPGITFEEYSEEYKKAAEEDRKQYVHHIEGPIENEAASKLAARFDDVVMGISTAGSNPFDFMKASTLAKAPSYPEIVIADERGSWSKASKRTGEWIVTASTADTIIPKEDKKAKRKAQKAARKQNRKK